jgi:hypothetical protein
VAPLLGLAVDIALHVAVSHALPSAGLLRRAAIGAVGGAVTTGVVSAVSLVAQPIGALDAGSQWVLALLTYVALAFGYFNFVNLNVTSLRIRLLRELLDHHPRGLTRDDIVHRYGAETVLRLRLERLLSNGHVVRRGHRYCLDRRTVLVIAHTFTLLNRVVVPRSEWSNRQRKQS